VTRELRAVALLDRAVGDRAFPGAVAEVGTSDGVLWRHAVGSFTYEPDAPAVDDRTVYDLASLTKVVVTASLAMNHVAADRLDLDRRVSALLPDWRGTDRDDVSIRDLLEHCAGLTAWSGLYLSHHGRREFEHAIGALALEYAPRTQSVYSDLGFMLLGFILADAGGSPLDRQFATQFGHADLTFRVDAAMRARTAPTEVDAWRGRLLVGDAHDENCWALGGVAGHAGLFGTAPAVGAFARLVMTTFRRTTALGTPELLNQFVTKSSVPGSSRALAWDTMLPTSSCGARLSARAIGHTGFTGTSLWIDPERDRYIVLLTNRVHPHRPSPQPGDDALRVLRPAFHDAVMDEFGA
jgi:CubicO group peptidase (beta-lactamase class C family)